MSLPILYSFRRCPYAIRARLAIQVSGFSCHLREVILRDKPAALIAASAKATVPVLVLADGKIIDQSLDIMLHVLDIHDPMNWLDTKIKMQALELIEATQSQFKPHLDLYKYASRAEKPEPELHRGKACEFLGELDAMLMENSFLLGKEMSLADAGMLPFVRQFAQTDRAWFDKQVWENLHAWLQAFEGSDLRNNVMGKYARWNAGDEGQPFPWS